ncbi:AtMMH-1 [Coprinopsis cinerea okayama7|uniref:AtMMH-1 n=1 Tax=Coprinopsis cinerea (strain Okayama-7 / 130 / ATCC MYA-4618 / FGSC 9003) TaxID=240176 RepID=A8N258_COPC7|nr:AtMMH-1 [Coprinopsis cinerea okayama7\|eukprot:XP_001828971.2 AtMMH-1 [Coprinopsis cinerea okayama7\
MPELPEVQRAVNTLKHVAKGKRITKVVTYPDPIVFNATTNEEFGKELENRTVSDAKRYGKVFYLDLDGKGKKPVLHFGMTGMLHVKGVKPMHYKEAPRKDSEDTWPPRFCKFILHLQNPTGSSNGEPETEVAFIDARRLARIRLCTSPMEERPISELGFDPLLSMPSLETFSRTVLKRSCPIKALLLDQSFSAGVGNWVADEVLYHARIHPEQRCNTLTTEQLKNLHHCIVYVCQTAVDVDADHKLFPENWLFGHRWNKGKKSFSVKPLMLPSGSKATIKWITVGGRTSAYVPELQRLSPNQSKDTKTEGESEAGESDLTSLVDSDEEEISKNKPAIQKRKAPKSTEQPARQQPARSSKRLKGITVDGDT